MGLYQILDLDSQDIHHSKGLYQKLTGTLSGFPANSPFPMGLYLNLMKKDMHTGWSVLTAIP
jgi:hypothetical protein